MATINSNMTFGSAVPNFVAIDTEANGINPWRGDRIFSAAAAFVQAPYYVSSDAKLSENGTGSTLFWRDDELHSGSLRHILEDPTIDKVFHNAKFDVRMLRYSGFRTIRGNVWDTMIFAHLLNGRMTGKNLGLEQCAIRYLPNDRRKIVDEITLWFKEHRVSEERQFLSFGVLPPDLLKRRNVGDAELTRDIFLRFYKTTALTFPFLLKQEHRLLPVVDRMEDRGICVDYEEIDPQIDYFNDIYEDCMRFFEGVTGNNSFNIDSRDHQMDLLRAGSCITADGLLDRIKERTKPGKHRRSTKPFVPKIKMDDWNLRQLHHPISHMLLLGKAAKKMRDTFLESLKAQSLHGVLHPNFNQLGTTTGRFSCSNPNLQNIPIEGDRRTSYTEDEANEAFEMTGINYAPHLKRIFAVRPGCAHIHSDKKQAEMFMMGHYAADPATDAIFRRSIESGKSIHDEICMSMYGEWTKGLKTRTKAVVFGYQYGSGNETLAKKIGGSIMDAITARNRLGRTLPGLPKLKRQLDEQIAERGFVQTIHGRRHYLRDKENYIAVNRMCQGSVGDEIKSRMIALNEHFEAHCPEACLLLNIHDDLCTEIPIEARHEQSKDIHRIMEETSLPYRLPLPSSLDITYTRWSDLVEIDPTKPFPEPADAPHHTRPGTIVNAASHRPVRTQPRMVSR